MERFHLAAGRSLYSRSPSSSEIEITLDRWNLLRSLRWRFLRFVSRISTRCILIRIETTVLRELKNNRIDHFSFPPFFFFFLASSRCALSFVIRIRLFDIWRYAIDEISISRKTTRTLIHRNGIKIKRRGFTDIWKEICSRFHEKWTRYIWMSREGYEPVTINVSDVKEDEGSSHGKGKRRSWRIFRFDRMKRETKREWIRRDRSMEIWIKFVRYDLPVHP